MMTMTEKFKILAKFIKDASSETADVETYLFVKENISNAEKDKIIDENFIKGDFHFNKKGNKIIAEVLIDNFEKR